MTATEMLILENQLVIMKSLKMVQSNFMLVKQIEVTEKQLHQHVWPRPHDRHEPLDSVAPGL